MNKLYTVLICILLLLAKPYFSAVNTKANTINNPNPNTMFFSGRLMDNNQAVNGIYPVLVEIKCNNNNKVIWKEDIGNTLFNNGQFSLNIGGNLQHKVQSPHISLLMLLLCSHKVHYC